MGPNTQRERRRLRVKSFFFSELEDKQNCFKLQTQGWMRMEREKNTFRSGVQKIRGMEFCVMFIHRYISIG